MTILQSIILGIIQGFTEFLPISSSGHLVLTPYLFGWEIAEEQDFIFGVLVQMGTLVAVILYFWRDLVNIASSFITALIKRQPFGNPQARLGWLLILATIPAGLFGILVKDSVEEAFSSPIATAVFLFITAGLLLISEVIGKRSREFISVGWKDALMMGLFQAISVFPGVSRSGSTITGGMLRNLDRPSAARFSFLMSIPVMAAAGLLATLDMFSIGIASESLPVFIPGIITAGIVGYLSIHFLLRFLARSPLYIFSAYCTILALVVLFFAFSVPEQRTVTEQVEVYHVEIAPEVAYLEEDIRACADRFPEVTVFTDIKALPSTEDSDITLVLGELESLPPFVAQVREEEVSVVVHPENGIKQISIEDLKLLYTGNIENWSQMGEDGGHISVWTFPQENSASTYFEQSVLSGAALTGYAYIAPGPEAMIEAVSEDPGAIGFLPASWMDERIRKADLTPDLNLRLPVLALAQEEPEGYLREIVACLQEG